LFIKQKITLLEALTGFSFTLTHLDGRVLRVSSTEGGAAHEPVKPGTIRCVRSEGMPQQSNPYKRGDLFVEIDVVFPKPGELDERALRALTAVLPRPVLAAAPRKSVPPPRNDGSGVPQERSEHPSLQDFYEVTLEVIPSMADERRRNAAREEEHNRSGGSEAHDEDDEDGHHHHGRRGGGGAGCQQQ
jgi:DnaJ-class molecular chaperone